MVESLFRREITGLQQFLYQRMIDSNTLQLPIVQ
jgi:hypothetical protein